MSTPRPPMVQRLPVALFGAVMGIAGLGLAWRRAEAAIGAPTVIGETILLLATLVYVVVLLAYAGKLARHRAAVAAEFVHPLAGSFFAAIAISALLLAAGLAPHAPAAARALWIVGAAGEYLAAITAVRGWIVRATPREAANPAWFVPVVGCIVAPIAGAPLGFQAASWILFGTGIVAWLFLMPMVVQRLVFEAVVPAPATPTICILIAPPAVGFIALDILAGGSAGAPAHILFGGAIFFGALALSMASSIARAPFGVPWWAMSFPSAALAAAALRYAEIYPSAGIAWLAVSLLALATALIAFLAVRSLATLARGELF